MFKNQLVQKVWASSVAVILTASLAFAQYTQPVGDNGSVDWSQQKIKATGIGAPNPNAPPGAQRAGAITAAKSDALRNLLATVRGMYLTSETTVNNAIVENDVIKTRPGLCAKIFRKPLATIDSLGLHPERSMFVESLTKQTTPSSPICARRERSLSLPSIGEKSNLKSAVKRT